MSYNTDGRTCYGEPYAPGTTEVSIRQLGILRMASVDDLKSAFAFGFFAERITSAARPLFPGEGGVRGGLRQ